MSNKKKYKQYFTPLKLAEFMVQLIPDDNIKTVIDLSMGECGLLEEAKKRWNDALHFGADIDETLLNKIHIKSPYIKTFSGDSLGENINHWEEYRNIINEDKYDLVLANPPFNFYDQDIIRVFDDEEITLPIEMRFLMKYIDIVRDGGYISIILPYGFLSLDLYEKLRLKILTKVRILRVIKVFPKCFNKTDVNTCLILMRIKDSNDCSIQDKITIEYLNDAYLLENIATVNCNDGLDRLDLEYHQLLGELHEIQDTCIYPMALLSDFVEKCQRGKTLAKRKDLIINRGNRFLHTTDIKHLYISNKLPVYVSKKGEYFQQAVIELNDILIGRVGKGCIGKVAIMNRTYPISVISDCLFSIRVNTIDPYYLAVYIASTYGQKQLLGVAKGSCSRYITKVDLMKIKVIVPDIDIQESIRLKYIKILSKPGRGSKENLLKSLVNELEKILGKECN